MKAELIPIGNSRGIRIPKPLIEQAGLGRTVDLRVENDRLIISSRRRPREGWDAMFREAAPGSADELVLEIAGGNAFDREEWEW